MRRMILTLCAALAAVVPLVAAPVGADSSSGSSSSTADGGTHSYLVLYADGASNAAGRQAVEDAGGTVTNENTAVGLAEVTSSNPSFLADVRASAAVKQAARNRSIGTARPGMAHKFKDERLDDERAARRGKQAVVPAPPAPVTNAALQEPLQPMQWDMQMIHATPDGSYAEQPGDPGVLVGVIDTGIDGSHPDIAPNFDAALSRNFTTDIESIDGPCADEPDHSCSDPADVDEDGHGTHVAGTIAAPINQFGMAGVAPDVTLVNLRAGQDSGYFFLDETVNALTYAADNGIDVVNMSFYIDPWLYNCTSADQYLKADKAHPTDEEIAEQALIVESVNEAVAYARSHDVTLVAAAGNDHSDLDAPSREDDTSPDFVPGDDPAAGVHSRTVSSDCLDLPSEAPGVISVAAIGPSGQKADYSNWGATEVDVAAPGGWFRDYLGTDAYRTPGNEILGPYPASVGLANGDIDPATGEPTSDFVIKQCDTALGCAYYQLIQGTSMASPHATGVAALIVSEFGTADPVHGGLTMAPDMVGHILRTTATDHACSEYNYALVGRHPASDWQFRCSGTAEHNNVYGEGIVDALAAVNYEGVLTE